ncbi:MAG: J domain-containing protein [Tissierellia bacterium]|nr:J domain-containing protein [Tissierellia bacterium]
MSNIIELPDHKKLKEEIKEFREKLEQYYFEHDHLIYTVCENIRMEYALEFGALEYNLFEAYSKYHRLRRKRDLIQEKINRQEEINLKEIEEALDNEFIEYKEKLDQKMSDIISAVERKDGEFLFEADTEELNKLYRILVKKLHPDLNKDMTDEMLRLFHSVIEYYKKGNLEMLRLINEVVENAKPFDLEKSSLKELQKERDRLEDLVITMEAKIGWIKSKYPYNAKIYLDDESKKQEKKEELKTQLNAYTEAIKTIEEYIKKLLGEKYE